MTTSSTEEDSLAHEAAPGRAARGTDDDDAPGARIAELVFQEAAFQGTRGSAIARLLACLLFLIKILLVDDRESVMGLQVFALGIGVIASVGHLLVARSPERQRSSFFATTGTVVDTLVVTACLLSMVLTPGPGYTSFLTLPETMFLVLTACTSALRLRQSVLFCSTLLNLAALVALCLCDVHFNGATVRFNRSDFLVYVSALLWSGLTAAYVIDRALYWLKRTAQEATERERTRGRLGAYLGEQVAQRALQRGGLRLGGQRTPVAVLFTDLRGFTQMSEQQAPEDVVQQLNAYFEAMVAVVGAHGGVVDKYIGDSLMLVFGATGSSGDDAKRAFDCASALQTALEAHNRERAQRGQAPWHMSVGGDFGAAVVGNIGTRAHTQYTVVGDVVNVASRLESVAKEEGVKGLLSKALVDAAQAQALVHEHAPVLLRGRSAPVDVCVLRSGEGTA